MSTENQDVNGYLKKKKSSAIKRIISNTNLRWFHISFQYQTLAYKKKKEDKTYVKKFNFEKIVDVNPTLSEKDAKMSSWKFGFELKLTDKSMFLYAETEKEKNKWVKCLNSILGKDIKNVKKEQNSTVGVVKKDEKKQKIEENSKNNEKNGKKTETNEEKEEEEENEEEENEEEEEDDENESEKDKQKEIEVQIEKEKNKKAITKALKLNFDEENEQKDEKISKNKDNKEYLPSKEENGTNNTHSTKKEHNEKSKNENLKEANSKSKEEVSSIQNNNAKANEVIKKTKDEQNLKNEKKNQNVSNKRKSNDSNNLISQSSNQIESKHSKGASKASGSNGKEPKINPVKNNINNENNIKNNNKNGSQVDKPLIKKRNSQTKKQKEIPIDKTSSENKHTNEKDKNIINKMPKNDIQKQTENNHNEKKKQGNNQPQQQISHKKNLFPEIPIREPYSNNYWDSPKNNGPKIINNQKKKTKDYVHQKSKSIDIHTNSDLHNSYSIYSAEQNSVIESALSEILDDNELYISKFESSMFSNDSILHKTSSNNSSMLNCNDNDIDDWNFYDDEKKLIPENDWINFNPIPKKIKNRYSNQDITELNKDNFKSFKEPIYISGQQNDDESNKNYNHKKRKNDKFKENKQVTFEVIQQKKEPNRINGKNNKNSIARELEKENQKRFFDSNNVKKVDIYKIPKNKSKHVPVMDNYLLNGSHVQGLYNNNEGEDVYSFGSKKFYY